MIDAWERPVSAAIRRMAAASCSDRPFPLHVDGDYIGEYEDVELGVAPGGLLAVA
jgi:hypothetical protein